MLKLKGKQNYKLSQVLLIQENSNIFHKDNKTLNSSLKFEYPKFNVVIITWNRILELYVDIQDHFFKKLSDLEVQLWQWDLQ